jgi:hypothetical protein
VLAGLALALRFIPYSDDRGNFDPFWTVVMGVLLTGALVASVYVIDVLEILKLRRIRLRQRLGIASRGKPPPAIEAEVDAGVLREIETGNYAAVNPATGEMRAVDPDTGSMEAVRDAGSGGQQELTPPPGTEPPARVPDTDDSSPSPGGPPGPEPPPRN